jgi:predicted DNA-binding protein
MASLEVVVSSIGKKNLHVPLPADLHEDLKAQAQRVGEPATVLARKAIEERIHTLKREQIADEIAAYAREVAGTVDDFDPAIEAAGLDVWGADDDDWREEDAAPHADAR